MTDKQPNPIAFNPDTMTVGALKQCADILRTVFDGMDRGVDADNILHNLSQARDIMIKRFGVPG